MLVDGRGVQHTTEYDSAGLPVRRVSAAGTPAEAQTELDYDRAGQPTQIRSPRYFDSTDTQGFGRCSVVMTYDARGNVGSRESAPNSADAGTVAFEYDLTDRCTKRTDARGSVWQYADAACCGASRLEIDPLGHGWIRNADASGNAVHTVAVTDVGSQATLADPINSHTVYEHTTRVDQLGRSVGATQWLQPLGVVDRAKPTDCGLGWCACFHRQDDSDLL